MFGTANGGRTLVALEAKADEDFGPYAHDALVEVDAKPASNLPARIDALTKLIFGDVDGSDLRYQLLHGLAATVLQAQAREADQAVFAIHEFRTFQTDDAKHEANHQDLRDFMHHFGAESLVPGILQRVGIHGAPGLPIFVGITLSDTTKL